MKKARKNLELAKKLQIAYAKYGYVPAEKIDLFNERLKKESMEDEGTALSYKRLLFTPTEDYTKVPPGAVLDRLAEAMDEGIFDKFEVATVQWVKEVKDPIIFARIIGCTDLFFIAQWDDDVSIEEILNV